MWTTSGPEDTALALLRRIHEHGCPTYRDNSGSRSRDGCSICSFCDANIECREPHSDGCLWSEVEAFLSEPLPSE